MINKLKKIVLCLALVGSIFPIVVANQINDNMYSYETTLEDVFTKEEILEINNHIQDVESQGLTLESIKVKVYVSPTRDNTIRIAEVEEQYTGATEEHSVDSSKGMKQLLNIAWDFTLNILSDTISWLEYPATILGVSPSDFMSTWYSGDSLKSTLSYVETTRYYRGTNDWGERTFFVTQKIVATTYADLYTKKDGVPFRKTDEITRTYKTRRFDDQVYSIAYAKSLMDQGVMIYEEDVYVG